MNDLKTITILFRAKNSIEKVIREDVKEYGLNLSEFACLEALYHKGILSIQEVQKKILIRPSSTTYVIQQLSSKGFIERKVDQNDLRSSLIRLSEKGKEFLDDIYPKHQVHLRSVLNRLSDAEEKQLQALLKVIGKYDD